MIDASDLLRFREELPFYVNGTSGAESKAFMSECLNKQPDLQAEVEFTQALRSSVKLVGANRREDEGLDRLLQAIEAQQAKTFTYRWKRFLESCSDWGLSPAFAAMAFIAVVQSVILWQSHITGDTLTNAAQYRSMSETVSAADMKLTINPDIGFGNLVVLLRQVGAHIVYGPSESGELWIALDDHSQLKTIAKQLRETPGIIDVIEVGQP
ncbi:MAG TPA: hypothetical protein VIF10_10605 [Methylobacter sp.]|jgi:hypothetical protein